MRLTEEDARTKWCPHVRINGFNRDLNQDAYPLCIASNCMAWRWYISNFVGPGSPSDRSFTATGFCGLSGQPKWKDPTMKRTLSILACIFLSPWAAHASYDSPEGTVWGPPLTSAPLYHPRSASFRGIRPELVALASTPSLGLRLPRHLRLSPHPRRRHPSLVPPCLWQSHRRCWQPNLHLCSPAKLARWSLNRLRPSPSCPHLLRSRRRPRDGPSLRSWLSSALCPAAWEVFMTGLRKAAEAAREALARVPAGPTASYDEKDAEWRGHDKAGDRANKTVREVRDQCAAALAALSAALRGGCAGNQRAATSYPLA